MATNSHDKEAEETLKVLDMLKAQKLPVVKKKKAKLTDEEEELTNSKTPRPFAPPAP